MHACGGMRVGGTSDSACAEYHPAVSAGGSLYALAYDRCDAVEHMRTTYVYLPAFLYQVRSTVL